MNRHRPIPVLLAFVLASAFSFAARAGAQKRPDEPAANRQQRREDSQFQPTRAQNGPQDRPAGPERGVMGLPPKWVERLQDMPPDQQERFMRNNERFNSLPPERQAQIRRNLQTWNNMTPDQRQEIRDREQVWERLTPDQQRYVQQVVIPRWQTLPQQRKAVILQHLRALQNLSDADRQARLNDPAFMQGLSPDEQHLLRDLSTLRVGGADQGPQQ